MCADYCFDIQSLLVAKVIVHRSNVGTCALADIANGCPIESTLGEYLASRISNAVSDIINYVFCGHIPKLPFKTAVSINCMEFERIVNGPKKKGGTDMRHRLLAV